MSGQQVTLTGPAPTQAQTKRSDMLAGLSTRLAGNFNLDGLVQYNDQVSKLVQQSITASYRPEVRKLINASYKRSVDINKKDISNYLIQSTNLIYPSILVCNIIQNKNKIKSIFDNIIWHLLNDLNNYDIFKEKLDKVKLINVEYTNLYKLVGIFILDNYNSLKDNNLEEEEEYNCIIEEPFLKLNQIKAINNTIEQGFISGIHHQIMGAGKTFIMLNLIQNQ